MPIADCGFDDSQEVSGSELLLRFGPTLFVDIGFDPEYKYGEIGTFPKSAAAQVPALIDTGALVSCIDNSLAQSLALPLVDRQSVSGVGGKHECNVYLAHIVAPTLAWVQWGVFYGVSLVEGDQAHQALIGRSFLQGMMLVYDGRTGRVQIAR